MMQRVEPDEARKEERKAVRSYVPRHAFTAVAVIAGIYVIIFQPDRVNDCLRSFLLAIATVNLGLSARIIVTNFKISKMMTGMRTSLLPLHVMLVATSYVIGLLSLHIWVIDRWSYNLHWYGLPFIAAFDITGLVALRVIWKLQQIRLSSLRAAAQKPKQPIHKKEAGNA